MKTLIDSFLVDACRQNGRRGLKLSGDAIARFEAYDYPGNVRELRNLIERVAILGEGPIVSGADAEALLPRRRAAPMALGDEGSVPPTDKTPALGDAGLPPTQPGMKIPDSVKALPRFRADKTFRDQVDEAEREIILGALSFTRDNATEAARLLDLERGHFYKKMKSLGLKRAGGETTSATDPVT